MNENSATHLLYDAANRPPMIGKTAGTCRVCGLVNGTGQEFARWVRPTFTDWDKLVPGDILCHACQFSFCEQSGLLARLVGKEKPQRMRNYSHFVVDGEWIPLSKANKPRMTDILLHREPEVAVIAQSGQKHLVFRAVPGTVQFEEQQITDISLLDVWLAIIEELYVRFSKSEIGTGSYSQRRIIDFGIARWDGLERALAPQRQTALFELALFLAQKGAR